jgi:hypothetical protein
MNEAPVQKAANDVQPPHPGWHPDPEANDSVRYWDGAEWTDHRAPLDDRLVSSTVGQGNGGAVADPVAGSPDSTQRKPWLRRSWPWLAAGVAGLFVGAGIGAAGHTATKTSTEMSTVTDTVTNTQTETVDKVKTVHDKAPAAPVAATPSDTGSGSGNSYSGSGEKNIGTLNVPTDSVLKWRAGGGYFAINNDVDDTDTIDVMSEAGSGSTTVAAGTYHKVDILAVGDWSFTLVPK